MKSISTLRLLSWFSVLSGVVFYIIILSLSQVPQDEGDGLQHFAIARESWNDHTLFLDHWGKPLFILFSSTFAQFGFNGYVCFNILVYALSCLIAFKILEHYQTPKLISIFLPWILITIPDYSNSVIGGMTEPLFGILLLTLFWLALQRKWVWFALIASFLPFARSEGMLVVIAAVPYLLLFKQWKILPLLTCGFLVYALLGWWLIDQPMWYFENDPYPEISPYGSGNWYQYIEYSDQHFGVILKLLTPIALFGFWVWKHKGTKSDLFHVLFFSGIYIGIIAIHSYLWANGLRGALGLSRLGLLGLLPFMVILGIAIGYVLRELHVLVHAAVSLLMTFAIIKETRELSLPTKCDSSQLALKEASDFIAQHEHEAKIIYYFHPLIVHFQGKTTKEKSRKYQQRFIYLKQDAISVFKPGDIIVRDFKFGGVEQGLDFDELKKYPWIVPVKRFFAKDYYSGTSSELKAVIIYEVMNQKTFDPIRWEQNNKKISYKNVPKVYTTPKEVKDEYYNLDTTFTLPKLSGAQQELFMTADVSIKGNDPVFLIFDEGNGFYLSVPLTSGTTEFSLPFIIGNTTGLLFIHNPSRQSYQLRLQSKYWQETIDPGIQPVK